MAITNYLSIDVEDYFHVSAFEDVSPPESWENREIRVDRNTRRLLEILREKGAKATFFVLGWVAHRRPELVREIQGEGHEVASHGYGHRRIGTLTRAEFREDVRRSKKILEDLTGAGVVGYRAPSYSISRGTLWAYDEIVEAGYLYDSSVFPIRHDLYGIHDWPRFSCRIVRDGRNGWTPETPSPSRMAPEHFRGIVEIPITTLDLWGCSLPIAGGGYFRLYPYPLTRRGLRRINAVDGKPFVFYLHPWEIDPGQPRMEGARAKSRFRHYLNLDRTEERFRSLLGDFAFQPLRQALGRT